MKKPVITLASVILISSAVTANAQNNMSGQKCPEDAIMSGLYHDDAPTMKMIIEHCEIPNKIINKQCSRGICNPLVVATMQNRLDTIKVLVEAGANININSGGSSGDTPLIFAMMNDNKEIVRYLVNQGADVNLKNNFGASPWWGAIASQNKEMIPLFLANGADVNATGRFPDMLKEHNSIVQGITPLMIAAKNNDYDLVKQLINKQANLDLADSLGRTALDYAHTDEMKRLLSPKN